MKEKHVDGLYNAVTQGFCYGELKAIRVSGELADGVEANPASARAGAIPKLEVDAVVFRQSKAQRPLSKADAKEANANFSTFRERDLKRLAKSFKGRPFLRDHNRDDLLARGGTIKNSELTETETHFEIHQTVELVKPWAQEAALDGTLEAFSIGWDPPSSDLETRMNSVNCTVCRCSMFSSDCPHLPGDSAEVDGSDQPVIVEAEFSKPRGAEVSGVTFPAVAGTQVEAIRAALSEARNQTPKKKARRMNKELLARLGLSEDATDEQIAEAVGKVADKAATADGLTGELKTAKLEAKASESVLEEIRMASEKTAQDVADEELKALHKGALGVKFAAGSDREKLFLELAEGDIKIAKRYVDSLPKSTPVGELMQNREGGTGGGDPAAGGDEISQILATDYGKDAAAIEMAKKQFRQLGITPEMLKEHGPVPTAEKRRNQEPWMPQGEVDPRWLSSSRIAGGKA